MSLSLYKKKRSFSKTPEPEGGKTTSKNQLVFVVQKHDASHLHYDFRLEMEGVLKSWAIPKGPSLNPEDKRLAMMVEDHPFDYRTFEGIIPEGNYGAGTVIVWDEGTYEPLENPSNNKKENEKNLLRQLHAGSLKFVMHGKKLKGEFALVKTAYRGENSWLLIKHRDDYATTEDITEKDKSVVSKKTIEQVEKTSDRIWKSNREAKSKTKSQKLKTITADSSTLKTVSKKKTKRRNTVMK
jgi:bifunctional non-homologous end joining protein LigD